jgi:hypothetical protein
MTCLHFQPNVPNSGQLGPGVSSPRIDVCALLMPSELKRETYREGLLARGFKLAHAFACPVASGGRWKACPFFAKPEKRGRRRR